MSGIDIRVLGPLSALNEGREAHLTSRRVRAFVAALTVNVGRPVTVAELVDAVWGDAQPENPRRALQLAAWRARAILGQIDAAEIIVTSPDGYRLDLPIERTDLGRVRRFLQDADRAAEAGDLERELTAVSGALDQWRAEPLLDVPSDVLQREVAPWLREQRLQLAERRVDIMLRLERFAEITDELMVLTAQHPLRERLWGQLMDALRRRGRRVEALNAYHTLRRNLADELGIDPSEPIRALHTAILTSQPVGARRPAPLPSVPRQLPPDIRGFTGRQRELSKLDELAATVDTTSGPVVVVITGTAGVGKSTLATHWAHRVADDFPDGQFFVDLRGYHPAQALTPAQALARFLHTLGVRGDDVPADVEERAALYRSLMDGRRALVLIDNANSAAQLRPLLPGAVGCLVLVTSRDQLVSVVASDGACPVPLDLLSVGDAGRLLAERLGRERLAAEPEAVRHMIAASARLPLALAIVAARAAVRPDAPLGKIAARLRDGLDAFDTASPATDVRAVFSWSYRELDPAAARLFRLLGLHPGPDLPTAAAASLGGLSPGAAKRVLGELVRAHLVVEHEPGRFSLHDLLRAYAAELAHAAEPEDGRYQAARRLLDHYLHTGHGAATILNPQRTELVLGPPLPGAVRHHLAGYDEAMGWFNAERETMLSLLRWSATTGRDVETGQLAWVLAGFLERQGYWDQWTQTQRAAIAAAERLGDGVLEAHAHRGLGRAYARRGQAVDAHHHYRRALELYRLTGHLGGQARTETNLALLHEQHGRHREALAHALRALALQQRLGDDPVGHANALNTVAWCHAQLGEYEPAVRYCRMAIERHEKISDLDGQAATLDTLGYALHHLGRYDEAVISYRRAIDLYVQLGDSYYASVSLVHLGETFEAVGDVAVAHTQWRQAETILAELDHPALEQVRRKLAGAATVNPAMTR
ncbi:BTAD domain-containing putative transcriptional regulator [Asanoa sp. WMMD1127]|uniref:AfsR/SARP family transcriptional regulator n=1 Tax=Asanoa sp. WMMD1127 TaxID=3016107 RepID=UPI00241769D6|nr:BTAD domain-containing putative transcriptional regulator [Asanoa sp. WMMD1127]MDG4825097.1 BTAD domain-containing putative transcriptional regulator [Asanoa sp. WMMD1127]